MNFEGCVPDAEVIFAVCQEMQQKGMVIKMGEMTFILVSGFYSSGSSAAVDLLKEFRNTYECKAEIRIIKDPYGLCQMEDALVNHWELINSSAAISDYIWLCKICSRSGGGKNPFARAGLNYNKTIHSNFMGITYEYIEKLTSFRYRSDFYYAKFKKNYFRYMTDRCRMGVELYTKGKLKIANRKHLLPTYFAKPTQEEFNVATQDYFEKLYADNTRDIDTPFIIMDQAVSPNNTQVIHRYFKNAKMVIVDRDPRDMFVDDMVNWGENLDDDCHSAEAGMKYVLRQKALRSSMELDTDILYIRFEDLILNYEETTQKLLCLLGFSADDHINKNKYLKPELSSKNIGIWKKHYGEYKDAIDVISRELPELCYNQTEDR